jgi:hypothetical protein
MPTGYTAEIHKGITFKQFVMTCARAMGALVMMRDEPSNAEIPAAFEPSTYHTEQLPRLRDKLGNLRVMTVSEAQAAAADDYAKELESHETRARERADLRVKYTAMLDEVNGWKPPTTEHENFKTFMQEQLTSSIDFDCCSKYDPAPEQISAQKWLERELQSTLQAIEYHEKGHAEEVERTQKRNDWLSALRESLADKT